MTRRMIIAFFILFVVSSASIAGELAHTCKVTHVYTLNTGIRAGIMVKSFNLTN